MVVGDVLDYIEYADRFLPFYQVFLAVLPKNRFWPEKPVLIQKAQTLVFYHILLGTGEFEY